MQVYHQTHDENQALAVPGKMLGGLGKLQQPKTARKALGNITNTSRTTEGGLGKQTPAGVKTARKSKALGDITNLSKPAFRAQPASSQQVLQKPAVKSTQQVRPAPAALSPPCADEPVEALAGKGWRQLAAEAEEREHQEIASRVRNFWRTAVTPRSVSQPAKVSGSCSAVR